LSVSESEYERYYLQKVTIIYNCEIRPEVEKNEKKHEKKRLINITIITSAEQHVQHVLKSRY